MPLQLPVEVTGYQPITTRPVPLLGAYFGYRGLATPYRSEPGDVQIGVDLLGPWDHRADVRVGEGWVILRRKSPDRWVILEVDLRADYSHRKGGPLHPSPAHECATPVQAVDTFMQGNIAHDRRMALQCSYFWKWSTDHPEYVAQYTIWKPVSILQSMIAKAFGPFTFMAGDVQVTVRYVLAHQYRGLLRQRTPPVGFLSFYLRRSADGDWKILSVTHQRDD